MAERAALEVPRLIDLGPDTKDAVIGSIKLVLKRLKQKGVMAEGTEYGSLLSDPTEMRRFIQTYKQDRGIARDVAVDKTGKPVASDGDDLVCGVTLAQIERLLVNTCAKRLFKRSATGDGNGEIPSALKPWIAFDWQLSLLPLYARKMEPFLLKVLDRDILALRSVGALEEVIGFKPIDVQRAKQASGERFGDLLANRPDAVPAAAQLDQRTFAVLDALMGDMFWDFLGRDFQLVVEVAGTSIKRIEAMGPSLGYMCLRAFKVIDDLPTLVLTPFMETFHESLGDMGNDLLGDEQFVSEMLKDIVMAFKEMGNSDKAIEGVGEVADLKWMAIRPKLETWVQAKKAGRPVALAAPKDWDIEQG